MHDLKNELSTLDMQIHHEEEVRIKQMAVIQAQNERERLQKIEIHKQEQEMQRLKLLELQKKEDLMKLERQQVEEQKI